MQRRAAGDRNAAHRHGRAAVGQRSAVHVENSPARNSGRIGDRTRSAGGGERGVAEPIVMASACSQLSRCLTQLPRIGQSRSSADLRSAGEGRSSIQRKGSVAHFDHAAARGPGVQSDAAGDQAAGRAVRRKINELTARASVSGQRDTPGHVQRAGGARGRQNL